MGDNSGDELRDEKSCIPLDTVNGDAQSIESEYVHKMYETIAPHFSHTRYNPWPGVVKFIKAAEPYTTVLDVGCGNGKYLELRKDLYFIGVDRCIGLLELAKNAKGSNLLRCDCMALPFKSETAELTLSIAVIHHLVSHEQRIKAVTELLRCTKRGGRAVIYVWAREQKKKTTGYRNFESGDLLVPWHMQERYLKDESNGREPVSNYGTKKLYRYYHVFTRDEVETLGSLFNEVAKVESIEFEANNWILTLLKM
ncbi:hypothetical protein BgAZ_304370 [Babesia gibsoni]|uniref:Methyltransferase type 11 domain-containing protein n=1 Tax=Babesia gibsoni TaxID=33632 RepID=A0AAD8LIP5_BABGI|nr:hypothetical protein BgAZ_304370 [Babesia gibsoni]